MKYPAHVSFFIVNNKTHYIHLLFIQNKKSNNYIMIIYINQERKTTGNSK